MFNSTIQYFICQRTEQTLKLQNLCMKIHVICKQKQCDHEVLLYAVHTAFLG